MAMKKERPAPRTSHWACLNMEVWFKPDGTQVMDIFVACTDEVDTL